MCHEQSLGSKQDVKSVQRRRALLRRELQDARELNFQDEVLELKAQLDELDRVQFTPRHT